jgi:hypothetical protein
MTTLTVEHLNELHTQLTHYVDPTNKDGFYRKFALWVFKTWKSADFYDTEVRDTDFDCSTFPVRTGTKLTANITTYCEFINANTGQSECTFSSGSGMRCQDMSEPFGEMYGEACSEFVSDYVAKHDLTIPDTYQYEIDDDDYNVTAAIFCELFDYEKDPELYDASADIASSFNQLGYGQEQYTCPIQFDGEYEDNHFGKWTLADFKKELMVK